MGRKTVRCRTIGDMTCTGVAESKADNIEEIIEEVAINKRLLREEEELMIKDQKLQWKTEKKKGTFKKKI